MTTTLLHCFTLVGNHIIWNISTPWAIDLFATVWQSVNSVLLYCVTFLWQCVNLIFTASWPITLDKCVDLLLLNCWDRLKFPVKCVLWPWSNRTEYSVNCNRVQDLLQVCRWTIHHFYPIIFERYFYSALHKQLKKTNYRYFLLKAKIQRIHV